MTRRVLAIVTLTLFLDLASAGIILPLYTHYVAKTGRTAESVGWLFTAFSIAQLVATPVMGRLSDRFGRRPVIVLSALGSACSMLVFTGATAAASFGGLLMSRLLAGATAANVSTCQAAIADVTAGEARARGIGHAGAAIGLGFVLGPMLGGILARLGPSYPPLGAAALSLAHAGAALLWLPETRRPHASSAGPAFGALREALADRTMRAVVFTSFLFFVALAPLHVCVPAIAYQREGWQPDGVGYAFGAMGAISTAVQAFLLAPLVRRVGEAPMLAAGAAILAAAQLGIAFCGGTPGLAASLCFLGVGMGIVNPMVSLLISQIALPGSQGLALGINGSSSSLGRAVGPLCMGFLYTRVAPVTPFLAAAALATLAMAVGLWLVRRVERRSY